MRKMLDGRRRWKRIVLYRTGLANSQRCEIGASFNAMRISIELRHRPCFSREWKNAASAIQGAVKKKLLRCKSARPKPASIARPSDMAGMNAFPRVMPLSEYRFPERRGVRLKPRSSG
jgi:hypothetical protein